jgi:hypothetical protein
MVYSSKISVPESEEEVSQGREIADLAASICRGIFQMSRQFFPWAPLPAKQFKE